MSTTTATSTSPDSAKGGDARPIKLRSACNYCFSAKVRCDGNKTGCKRCTDKRLDCTYSESMVGKVVGKRRKRPLPEVKVNDPKSRQWNVTIGPTTLPSPASTVISEQRRRSQHGQFFDDWASLVAYKEQDSIDFSTCDEQQYFDFNAAQECGRGSTHDGSFAVQTGLPTPSMSPPNVKYLSPAELEACSQSRSASVAPQAINQPTAVGPHPLAILQPPAGMLPMHDNEAVCMKLIAHVKRFMIQEPQSLESALNLIYKVNASVRQLLRNRTVRTDYACQLLLTNLVLHLTTCCERLLRLVDGQPTSCSGKEFINKAYLAESEGTSQSDQRLLNEQSASLWSTAKDVVQESAIICSDIGDLLKRKPQQGFQILGRHECAHAEIDRRLRHVLAALS